LEVLLQKAFKCGVGSSDPTGNDPSTMPQEYPNVCSAVQARRLCALQRDRAAIGVAVGKDRIRSVLRKGKAWSEGVTEDGKKKWDRPELRHLTALLEQMPGRVASWDVVAKEAATRETIARNDEAARHLAEQTIYAIVHDIREMQHEENIRASANLADSRSRGSTLSSPGEELAAVLDGYLRCRLAYKWGDLEDRAPCPESVSKTASEDVNVVVRHMLEVEFEESGRRQLERALQAAVLVAREAWPAPSEGVAPDWTQPIHDIVHAAGLGDDASVFAMAISTEPQPDYKAGLQALALASTGGLTAERADKLKLGVPKQPDYSIDITVGLGVFAGAQWGLQNRAPTFAGPTSVPLGIAYQDLTPPYGAYLAFNVFDPGEYFSVNPDGSVRKPSALDGFGPSFVGGLRFGGRIPLVVAAVAGCQRLPTDDRTLSIGLQIGTVLPLVGLYPRAGAGER
jgi:hypothetical protein